MTDRETVARLWQHQFGPWGDPLDPKPGDPLPRMHPYTCGNRADHPFIAGDHGVLVPTVRGWICPFCDYTQPFRDEAARREAENFRAPHGCDEAERTHVYYCKQAHACAKAGRCLNKPDAPPPPAPFVTDHKWLDPECHASGCQTLILKAEVEKLKDQRDKYMWQVRDTCARAEAAEARERRLREALGWMLALHDDPCPYDKGTTIARARAALAQGGTDG